MTRPSQFISTCLYPEASIAANPSTYMAMIDWHQSTKCIDLHFIIVFSYEKKKTSYKIATLSDSQLSSFVQA